MVGAFWHGLILAIALILPIGMQNGFLLSQGALHRRWLAALPAVVTAALCDTFLVALAVFGVSGAVFHIVWLRVALGIVGVAFLLYMGFQTWRENPDDHAVTSEVWSPRRQMGFAMSVSLLNPHALMDTLAVIGGSAAVYGTWGERASFAVACALVSWVWFFFLMTLGHVAGRAAAGVGLRRVINRISALMMGASAGLLIHILLTFR
ncbi:LysE/ArgO family amino acid transporter [Alicyclobacillus mali (ex Roth et al. 2021)]|uniref:LysE/ArgO family amino acid transporter n=1 Tax=Alicyclobacillus mali (ex Roth et al. 2021) TaxID=1123961 RepID=UPI001A8E3FFF|nr:LysE family transporter [Alicyclobacillus mali (ex Roth et al. 2021)]